MSATDVHHLQRRITRLLRLVQYLRRVAEEQAPDAARLPDWDRLFQGLGDLWQELDSLAAAHRQALALMDVARALNSTLELDQVLQRVMDHIIRLTQAERGFLMLRDEQGALRIVLARNWEQETLPRAEVAFSRSVVEKVVRTGEPVWTANARGDPRFREQESVVLYNLRSIMCVPLKVKDRLVGVIYTDNRSRVGAFSPRHEEIIMAFANHAAVALENARLFAQVRQALAEVTELKNLLDAVFASIASGVLAVETDDRIVLSNRAAERILGLPARRLIGRPWQEVLAPLVPPLDAYWQQVQRAEDSMKEDFSPIWPGRGRVHWRISLAPLLGKTNRPQGMTVVIDDLTEQRRLENLRKLFERMVSPLVIQQLDVERLQPGGEQRLVTVLFADVRGFTSFAETVTPEELVRVLNRYLAVAAEALLEEGGTVDKFMGDAVMAWFNAPVEQPDHALRAVRAALRIRERVRQMHANLPREQRLAFGIGIHTGPVVMGLVGTNQRLDYTVVGDSVNTAKRLEEAAGRDQILVSEATYRLLGERVAARRLPAVHLKGKRQPMPAYEVLHLTSPLAA